MIILLKLLIIPILLASVKSEFPSDIEDTTVPNNVDEKIFRIPEDLDPIHFEVEITPYLEAEGNNEAFTFDGVVTMSVKALTNSTTLTIHENVREIRALTIRNSLGELVPLNSSRPFERVRDYHFLKINLLEGSTLSQNETYSINIIYIGNINETPLSRGVFRGNYVGNDGKRHWYVAAHLQPTHSRQAFPCIDEPGFKSTFDIIINRPIGFTETFSNMPLKHNDTVGNRVREVFHTTPRMSASLVSFHISEEFTVIEDNRNSTHPYRIIARPNAASQGEHALAVGPQLTQWLSHYLGIDYYEMDKNLKNDQLATPDWASGATENWGLVSYRELQLLYQEEETNVFNKFDTVIIISHELAHKWFGNLVTCRWWDNVWINEGFATYFEYFAAHEVDKSLEVADQFIIYSLQGALSSDASASTRALEHTVNTPEQVTAHFTGISYSKGASLLLMLKHLIGESTFKKALNYFLQDRSFEHAVPLDLYNNFARAVAEDNALSSDIDIAAIFRYWVEERGYPVITVDVNMATGLINITQERFFFNSLEQQTNQTWPIPLTYTTENNPNWNNLTISHVMLGRNYQIQKSPGHEWVIFNLHQQGLYRVNYDTHTWQMIADALQKNHSSFHYMNRAQIVDDVFALMRSGRMTYALGFRVLQFLKSDTSYYSWYPAITGFSWLRNRFFHMPDSVREFDKILLDFLDKVIDDLGYDVQRGEPISRTLHRFYLFTFACSIGHDACIKDAVTKFKALKNNGIRVNPNIRRHVFCQGLLNGNFSDWQFLYQRRANSNNQADDVEMLRALGCAGDSQAVNEFLNMVLRDFDVRAQDSVNAMTWLYMGNRANAKTALQYLKPRVEEFRRKVVLPAGFESLLSNLADYLDEEGLNDMEQWLQQNQATVPSFKTGLNAIQSARSNMRWGTDHVDEILLAARGLAVGLVPSCMVLLLALSLLLR